MNFEQYVHAFLCSWGKCFLIDCHFVSGSYVNIYVSSAIIKLFKKWLSINLFQKAITNFHSPFHLFIWQNSAPFLHTPSSCSIHMLKCIEHFLCSCGTVQQHHGHTIFRLLYCVLNFCNAFVDCWCAWLVWTVIIFHGVLALFAIQRHMDMTNIHRTSFH